MTGYTIKTKTYFKTIHKDIVKAQAEAEHLAETFNIDTYVVEFSELDRFEIMDFSTLRILKDHKVKMKIHYKYTPLPF